MARFSYGKCPNCGIEGSKNEIIEVLQCMARYPDWDSQDYCSKIFCERCCRQNERCPRCGKGGPTDSMGFVER